jgi:hypothetical protein
MNTSARADETLGNYKIGTSYFMQARALVKELSEKFV